MTRKRYIKLKMAEGLSRNEAALNAREIVAEGLSYQEDYDAEICANIYKQISLDEYIALAEAVANMVNVIQPVVVRVARAICAAGAAFMAEMREVQE